MLLCVSACAFSSFDTYASGNTVELSDAYSNYTDVLFGLENFSDETYYDGTSINNVTIADVHIQDYTVLIDNSVTSFNIDVGANGNDVQTIEISDCQYYQLWYYQGIGKYVLTLFYFYDGVTPVCVNDKLFGCTGNDYGYLANHIDLSGTLDTENETLTFDTILSYGKFSCANPYTQGDDVNYYFMTNFIYSISTNLRMWSADNSYYSLDGIPPAFEGNNDNVSEELSNFMIDKTHAKMINASFLGSQGSGSSAENIANHLTLGDDTKFYISNTSFNNGTVYLYPVLDKTQLGDNESLDNYYFRFIGSVSTNTTRYNDYNYRATTNGAYTTLYFPMNIGSANVYDFTLVDDNHYYYDVPVGDAHDGSWSMPLSDFNAKFLNGNTDNYYNYLAMGYDSLFAGTDVFDTVSNIVSSISIKGVKFDTNSMSQHETDIAPNKVLYHVDLYIVKKTAGGEEIVGDVQSYIDGDICQGGISGENVNTTSGEDVMNALGTNYVPNSYSTNGGSSNYADTYNSVGGSSSSSSSSPSVSPSISGGENNINIINNNTNNGSGSGSTSESSLGSWSITTLLIKYIAGGKNSGVSYIEDLAGTNTYLNIVTSYMSFVPVEIWNLVITTFTVCLGCVVVAFIISIVIKIIT